MNAGHDWDVVAKETGGSETIEWCTLCGALRITEDNGTRHLWFPYAYEKVSRTTCAQAREARDAKVH